MKKLSLILLLSVMPYVLAGGDDPKDDWFKVDASKSGAALADEATVDDDVEQSVKDSWRMDQGSKDDLRAKILDSRLFSEDDEDCFSEADEDVQSKKGKGKAKSLTPSIKGLQKAGYAFFITGIRNVSEAVDLEVVRSRGKKDGVDHATRTPIQKGAFCPIATRAPKTSRDHLLIFKKGDATQPLWKIFQDVYRSDEHDTQGEEYLFVQKHGEDAMPLLCAAQLPQLIALKVRTSKIEVDLPAKVEALEPSRSMLSQLTNSLPSLPTISLPSLFADEGASGSSSSSSKSHDAVQE